MRREKKKITSIKSRHIPICHGRTNVSVTTDEMNDRLNKVIICQKHGCNLTDTCLFYLREKEVEDK